MKGYRADICKHCGRQIFWSVATSHTDSDGKLHNDQPPVDANDNDHRCTERKEWERKIRAEGEARAKGSQQPKSKEELAEIERWTEELRASFKPKGKAKGAFAGGQE